MDDKSIDKSLNTHLEDDDPIQNQMEEIIKDLVSECSDSDEDDDDGSDILLADDCEGGRYIQWFSGYQNEGISGCTNNKM